jgi:ABC-type sulfate/molybdate transport systems ATPase subunit
VQPRILLLDEPFGALDREVREELPGSFKRLHAELGITTLFVTHDQEEALALADQVVVLNAGRAAADVGRQVLAQGALSDFAARFLAQDEPATR